MTVSPRTQIIIGTTTLVCIVLIGLSFILFQQFGPSPASLLPAERTVAVFVGLSNEDLDRLKTIFPLAADASELTGDFPTVALVFSGHDGLSWHRFDQSGRHVPDLPILGPEEQTLSDAPFYRQLVSTYEPGKSWAFIYNREEYVQIPGLDIPAGPFSLSMGTGAVQIAWPARMESSFTGPVPAESEDTILRVSAAALGSLISDAAAVLTEENRMTAVTLLTSWIRRMTGPDVSAAYDVLPLLDGAGTLVVAQTASGTHLAVRVLPRDLQEESFERIEEGMLSTTAGVERITRTFDDTFSIDTVRLAEHAAVEETTIGAWAVRLSPTASVMTGRMGRERAFGTERLLFTSLLRAMQSSAGQHIAQGTLESAALDALLAEWQIRLDLPWSLLPAGTGVVWTLDQKGGLAVLRVSR